MTRPLIYSLHGINNMLNSNNQVVFNNGTGVCLDVLLLIIMLVVRLVVTRQSQLKNGAGKMNT